MKIPKILPAKFSLGWLLVLAIYILFIWGMIAGGITFILGNRIIYSQHMGILSVSAVMAFIICLFGFFHARIVYVLSTLGLLTGCGIMLFMFYTHGRGDSTDAILYLILSTILGLMVGILGHIIRVIVKRIQAIRA